MEVVKYGKGFYTLKDKQFFVLDTCYDFPTIQALENHIKLMLIAVQNYKGEKISQPVQQEDWSFDEPVDYSARYYHE